MSGSAPRWRPMRTAPKDGTRFLLLHDGYPSLCIHIAQWMEGVIPKWLFENAKHRVADLPGDNPYCKGRWVAEAAEALEWSNGIEGDERKVVESYVWDPVPKPLGWMLLPPKARKTRGKRLTSRRGTANVTVTELVETGAFATSPSPTPRTDLERP